MDYDLKDFLLSVPTKPKLTFSLILAGGTAIWISTISIIEYSYEQVTSTLIPDISYWSEEISGLFITSYVALNLYHQHAYSPTTLGLLKLETNKLMHAAAISFTYYLTYKTCSEMADCILKLCSSNEYFNTAVSAASGIAATTMLPSFIHSVISITQGERAFSVEDYLYYTVIFSTYKGHHTSDTSSIDITGDTPIIDS